MNHVLFGALIGDISGSRFEMEPYKEKEGYELIDPSCRLTDDSVMTIAVAKALIRSVHQNVPFRGQVILEMQRFGRMFPAAGYGARFVNWIFTDNPQPYNSWGNGSAMRVSPCGFAAQTMEEALLWAKESALPTHNHPEGIRGAQAVAGAIYLAKNGFSREEIRKFMDDMGYTINYTIDQIRPDYRFDVSCQGSVPQSVACFLESEDYEDTLRNAISLGGDSDTMAAISGAIAWAYYGRQDEKFEEKTNGLYLQSRRKLPDVMLAVADEFDAFCHERESGVPNA